MFVNATIPINPSLNIYLNPPIAPTPKKREAAIKAFVIMNYMDI